MEMARLTSKGQITIPIEIRKKLNLKEGDKVIFVTAGDRILLENSSAFAVHETRRKYDGLIEELNLHTEEDLINVISEIRKESMLKLRKDLLSAELDRLEGDSEHTLEEVIDKMKTAVYEVSHGDSKQ